MLSPKSVRVTGITPDRGEGTYLDITVIVRANSNRVNRSSWWRASHGNEILTPWVSSPKRAAYLGITTLLKRKEPDMSEDTKNVRVHIIMEGEIHRRVSELSITERRTLSATINMLIEKGLDTSHNP